MEGATIRIVSAEPRADAGQGPALLRRAFATGADTSQELLALLREAETRGALALSQVQFRIWERRAGVDYVCASELDPVWEMKRTVRNEQRPGLPPRIERVEVYEKQWSLRQSKPECGPSPKPADPAKPHEVSGVMILR